MKQSSIANDLGGNIGTSTGNSDKAPKKRRRNTEASYKASMCGTEERMMKPNIQGNTTHFVGPTDEVFLADASQATGADVIGQSSYRNNKASVEVAQESPATQTEVGGRRMQPRSDKHKLQTNLDHAVASAAEERSHDASEAISVDGNAQMNDRHDSRCVQPPKKRAGQQIRGAQAMCSSGVRCLICRAVRKIRFILARGQALMVAGLRLTTTEKAAADKS